jgi:hypothetical protein
VVAVYPFGYHEARQRTSSNLKLNPHVHAVFLDGAYRDKVDELDFRAVGHLSRKHDVTLERAGRAPRLDDFFRILDERPARVRLRHDSKECEAFVPSSVADGVHDRVTHSFVCAVV